MISDTHVHSYFSPDSRSDPEDNIKKAIENGQKNIILTDHYDHGVKCGKSDYNFDTAERNRVIGSLREKYEKQIRIITGIEIGQQPLADIIESGKKKLAEYDYDYVIGSTHLIDGLDPYAQEYFEGKTMKEAYTGLLETLIANANMWDNYDTLGHFDYTTRYAPYENRGLKYKDFPDLIDTLFRTIISKDVALELNTKTASRVSIDPDIWKRYRELGGELVTMGSDAHRPEMVGYMFKEFGELLKECGFDSVYIFINRKPVGEKID